MQDDNPDGVPLLQHRGVDHDGGVLGFRFHKSRLGTDSDIIRVSHVSGKYPLNVVGLFYT